MTDSLSSNSEAPQEYINDGLDLTPNIVYEQTVNTEETIQTNEDPFEMMEEAIQEKEDSTVEVSEPIQREEGPIAIVK